MADGFRRGCLTLAIVSSLGLPAWLSGAGGSARPTGSGALRTGDHGEPLVQAWVNGHGPFTFVVDTGSTHTSVTEDVRQALGLPIVARTSVRSSVGEAIQLVSRLDRLSIAEITATDLLASIVSRAMLDPAGRLDGIIGQDVLAMRRFTLDFARGRFLWDDDNTPPEVGGSSIPLHFESGRFVADLWQGHSLLRLVPDSGAQTLVLYEGRAGALVTRELPLEPIWLEAVTGRRLVRRVGVSEIRLGMHRLKDVTAVMLPHPDSGDTVCDGLLPLRPFTRVTFDGPGSRLMLER